MKHFTAMKSPYELVVGLAGIVAGGFTYLQTNLDLLDATYYINWEKIVGLFWGMLVALLTGMFAIFGKRAGDYFIAKFFRSKNKQP